MLSKKAKIILISVGGALVVGGGLGVGLGIGLSNKPQDKPDEPDPIIIPDEDPCPEGTCVDENQDGVCDVCGYPVDIQHGVSVGGDPSAPFYLKVGESKTITAKLTPSPDRDSEKTFTWKTSNSRIASVAAKSASAKADIEGLSEGNVTFTATNEYNPALVRNFEATVINYDDENMYLWEYQTSDRAKFGYVNEDGKKAGVADGVANLAGLDWTFHRSEVKSLQSKQGGVGFGKGSDPEKLVTLKSTNTREIKKIVIETASANSLANITVKVGDNEVINKATPKFSSAAIGSVSYVDSEENPSKYSGDILIQFDTPAFDESKLEDESYRAPGAVYLKSIWIEYYEINLDWKTNVTYDLNAKYLESKDADFKSGYFTGLTTSAKPLSINDEENGITINLEKIKQYGSSDNVKLIDHALTNGYIDIILNKPDEVIKQVKFEYINGTNKTTYTEYASVFGGAPFVNTIDSSNTGLCGKFISSDNVNAIRFVPKGNNVAVHSISVKTIEGVQLEIDSLSLKEGAAASKLSYKQGEVFDPEGLEDISVSFTNDNVNPIDIPSNEITWYDGPSYEDPADHSNASEILKEGTTYVIGVLNGHTVKYEGIEVVLVKMYLSLVKDASDINETDRYLIASPKNSAICLGSSGSDMNKADGSKVLEGFEFTDDVNLADSYENDLFKFEKDPNSEKYAIANFDGAHRFTVTKSGTSAAGTSKDGCQLYSITINSENGNATFTMDFNDTKYYLIHTGTAFDSKKDNGSIDKASIRIYKLNEIVDPRLVTE